MQCNACCEHIPQSRKTHAKSTCFNPVCKTARLRSMCKRNSMEDGTTYRFRAPIGKPLISSGLFFFKRDVDGVTETNCMIRSIHLFEGMNELRFKFCDFTQIVTVHLQKQFRSPSSSDEQKCERDSGRLVVLGRQSFEDVSERSNLFRKIW